MQTTPEFELVIKDEIVHRGLTVAGVDKARDYLLSRTNDRQERGIIQRTKRLDTLRGIAYNLRFSKQAPDHKWRMEGDVSRCKVCRVFLGLWDGVTPCKAKATITA